MIIFIKTTGFKDCSSNKLIKTMISLDYKVSFGRCSTGRSEPTARRVLFLIMAFLARLHVVQKSYCSHPGRTRSRSRSCSTLLKFSRSLYIDNQLSESIHTWTIDTL